MQCSNNNNKRDDDRMRQEGIFSVEALIRAMAPVQVVMDAFSFACRHTNHGSIGHAANQAILARLLYRIEATTQRHHSSHDPSDDDDEEDEVRVSCVPSRRYIHRLVHRYVALLEQQQNGSDELEDDDLMEWMYRGSMEGGRHHYLDDPNPTDSCYVTFRLPPNPHPHHYTSMTPASSLTSSTTTRTIHPPPPSRIQMDDNPNAAHSHSRQDTTEETIVVPPASAADSFALAKQDLISISTAITNDNEGIIEATTSGHNPNAVLDDTGRNDPNIIMDDDSVDKNGNGKECYFFCDNDTDEEKEEWLAIRVFPHHNQVGLQKVWEAGACLAEFVYQYPEHIRNKKVVEWGAGVGLTGFIVDRIGAERVHLTDGTSALVLDNLTHNVSLYQDQRNTSTIHRNTHTKGSPPSLITTGYFEWGDFVEEQHFESSSSSTSTNSAMMVERMKEFEVLLAADVVYDRTDIPHLVSAVRTFLEQGGEYAIFATTYRNQVTFDLFQTSLKQEGVTVQEIQKDIISNLPHWLPCYYSQLRSEVRIAIMTIK